MRAQYRLGAAFGIALLFVIAAHDGRANAKPKPKATASTAAGSVSTAKITAAPAPGPGPGCVSTTGAPIVIRPCIGPAGILINVLPQHDLDARPAKLVFRPLFPVRAPLQVIAVVSKGPTGFTVPAPKELCAYGAAWNVLALDTKGKLMGFEGEAGHFTIDCTKKTPAPHITPAPPSGPSPNCVSTTGAHIYIRPCIGVPGDVIAVLPQVMLTYKPWKLNFTPLFAVLGPTKVIASVEEHPGGFVVHAPVELCRLGPPLPPGVTMPPTAEFNWNVTATDEALKPMGYLGEVGHYKIKCTAEQTKTPLATPSSGPPAGCGGTSTLVKIDPCAGPPGTKIKVWKSSTLATTPALLIFKIFAPKSAPEIRAPITGGGGSLSATASAELCKYGPKWHVSVLDSTGTGLGDVGTFTIVCLAGGRPPPPTPTATPTPTPTPTPKPKLTPKPPGNKAPVPTPTPPGCSPMIPNCMLVPGQPNAFIVPPGQRVPPALRFQSAAGQVQPIVAQVQNAGGRLSFTIPSTMCRGSLAQWLVYAADANGAAVGQIGVAYTNC